MGIDNVERVTVVAVYISIGHSKIVYDTTSEILQNPESPSETRAFELLPSRSIGSIGKKRMKSSK